MKELLTPEEISRAAYQRNLLFGANDVLAYTRKPDADECIAKAQLSHTMYRFKQAVKQSLVGKEIDLSEKEFELFSAIQNSGTAKVQPLINKDCFHCHIDIDEAFEEAKRIGRKEVIDWVNNQAWFSDGDNYKFLRFGEAWQAKQNEWWL